MHRFRHKEKPRGAGKFAYDTVYTANFLSKIPSVSRRTENGSGLCAHVGGGNLAESVSDSLADIRILAGIEGEELESLERACTWRRYADHEQIIDRQSDSRDVFFVVEGRVRIVNYSLSGKEITLEDLDTDSHFGELSALDGQPRSASVMALNNCLIAALPQERFLALLKDHSEISFRVLRALAGIIRNSTDRIMDLSTLAANNRVQADLLRQARSGLIGENQAEIRPIPVHGDIASRVSTTRETVARVLSELSRQGVVERRKNTLLIKDLAKLREMVEEVRGE